jgi:hypothetical protein
MVQKFELWKNDVSEFFDGTAKLFNDQIISEKWKEQRKYHYLYLEIAQSLPNDDVAGLLKAAIASGLEELKKLGNKWLLEGEFTKIPIKEQQKYSHCPPTNDIVESHLGRTKRLKSNNPTMRTDTIEARLQMKTNKTLDPENLQKILKKVPNAMDIAISTQRKNRKRFSNYQELQKIGTAEQQQHKAKLEAILTKKRKRDDALQNLHNNVTPIDLETFQKIKTKIKNSELIEQLEYRKKLLYPKRRKESWALNIQKAKREELIKRLEHLLFEE